MPKYEISASVIDICLPDYLPYGSGTTHEILYAPLGMSEEETVDSLYDSIDAGTDLPSEEEISTEDIKRVLRAAIQGVDYRYRDEHGNPCDEVPDDCDHDEPYLYVRLDWTETGPGETCAECRRWIPEGEPSEHLVSCSRYSDE